MDLDLALAREWYERHKVTFPTLVDPNFAFNFSKIPHTYLVDERGRVRGTDFEEGFARGATDKAARGHDRRKPSRKSVEPVRAGERVSKREMARYEELCRKDPGDLASAVEFASRCLAAGRAGNARRVLTAATERAGDDRQGARQESPSGDLLAHAFVQLARSHAGDGGTQALFARRAIALKPPYALAKALRLTYLAGERSSRGKR